MSITMMKAFCKTGYSHVFILGPSLHKTKSPVLPNLRKCSKNSDPKKMVEPKRVVSYEDVLQIVKDPKKILIDVRNTDEIQSTGKIPSSINIPLDYLETVLKSMSEEDFRNNFKRKKPQPSDELIFYCRSGRRATEAMDKAVKLGYSNSKTYLGSWEEWSSKQK